MNGWIYASKNLLKSSKINKTIANKINNTALFRTPTDNYSNKSMTEKKHKGESAIRGIKPQ